MRRGATLGAAMIATLACATPAFADPPGETPVITPSAPAPIAPTPTPTPTPAPRSTDPVAIASRGGPHRLHRDRDLATLLSVAGSAFTFVAYAIPGESFDNRSWILATAALVTPSVGEWYAGDVVTLGMGMRVIGLTTMVLNSKYGDTSNYPGSLVTWFGAGAIIAGTIYDITGAATAADDFNARHLTLVPTALVTPTGSTMLGFGLAGSF